MWNKHGGCDPFTSAERHPHRYHYTLLLYPSWVTRFLFRSTNNTVSDYTNSLLFKKKVSPQLSGCFILHIVTVSGYPLISGLTSCESFVLYH